MNYSELLNYLSTNSNIEAKKFSEKIIPTKLKVIGTSTPLIKELAKRIISENIDTSSWVLGEYFDVDFLIINIEMKKKIPLEEKYAFLARVLPFVDNWAIIDSACDLRTKDYKLAKKFIDECLISPFPFMRRFGYIHYLGNFIRKDYLNDIFTDLKDDEHYYVQMAEAWLISVLLVKFPEETEEYLKNCKLAKTIINKAIQKIRDSRRVDITLKEKVLQYKK